MTLHLRLLLPSLFLSFYSHCLAKEIGTYSALYNSKNFTKTQNEISLLVRIKNQFLASSPVKSKHRLRIPPCADLCEPSTYKLEATWKVAEKAATANKERITSEPQKKDQRIETPPTIKPLQPDETVENVIHYLRIVSEGTAPQGNGELRTFTALLLKDGRVFENEELSPTVFDPAKRPLGSAGTGRWQRDGEAYALAFSDGTEGTAVSSAAVTFPAPPSMVLIGLFEEKTPIPHKILPHRLNFFKDGSLILERTDQIPQSGHYKINMRSIKIEDGQGTQHSFLFGAHEPLEKPQILVIGNKLYQRIDEEN